jgi:hypothetical protein
LRNHIALLLILIFFVTACAPVSAPESTGTLSSLDIAEAVTVTQAEKTQFLPTATPTLAPTLAPTLEPTLEPTSAATPLPVRFDLAGYRQFAITRSSFPGFEDYYGDRTFTQNSYALSPDGNLIAMSACWGSMATNWTCETRESGFLVVIDANTGELLNDIHLGNGWPGPLAFTPDSKSLLFSTEEFKVILWDLETNKPARTLLDITRTGRTHYPDVEVAPDGSSMSAVADGTLYTWDPSGKLLLQAKSYNTRASAALSYSTDGSRLILYSPDGKGIDIYNTSDWMIIRSIIQENIFNAEISPDGRLIAANSESYHSVVIWDIATGERLAEIDPGFQLTSLQFNPSGDLLIVGGYGYLDHEDEYSLIGGLYETQTWSRVDTLHSFSSEGIFRFNRDGSRMVVFGSYANTIWELPDAQLLAGYEVVKQFQQALATGDYDTAASLFEVIERDEEYFVEMGFDLDDLAGSLERFCEDKTIYCHQLKELVLMGYEWDTLVYMVRLEGSSGEVFTAPNGATIIHLYLEERDDGQLRVIYPALEY